MPLSVLSVNQTYPLPLFPSHWYRDRKSLFLIATFSTKWHRNHREFLFWKRNLDLIGAHWLPRRGVIIYEGNSGKIQRKHRKISKSFAYSSLIQIFLPLGVGHFLNRIPGRSQFWVSARFFRTSYRLMNIFVPLNLFRLYFAPLKLSFIPLKSSSQIFRPLKSNRINFRPL